MRNHLDKEIVEHYTSLQEIFLNINFYCDKFFEDGLLIFKKLYLTDDEQRLLIKKFGDQLNWYPNSKTELEGRYIENHLNTLRNSPGSSSSDVILEYHLECTNYQVPQLAGVWSMHTFKCSSDSGKTSFVDSRTVIQCLSESEVDFLRKCKLVQIGSGIFQEEKPRFPHPAIDNHPLYGYETLRVDSKPEQYQYLYSIEDRKPTVGEVNEYNRIVNKILENIHRLSINESVWHRWSEGDTVIVDLTLMYHAVSGGFSHEDREFTGLWAFPPIEESISQFHENKHLLIN